MRMSLDRARLITVGGLLAASAVLLADGTRFSDFTPLASSAGPTLDESAPIPFGNPAFLAAVHRRPPDSAGGRQAQLRRLGHEHRERDRPSQGPLPVHRVRTGTVRRAASRPADGRDRHDLDSPSGSRATSRSTPPSGRPGER